MSNKQILIYGAYGYSGELIAKEAIRNNLTPILAGRDDVKIKQLGEALNLNTLTLEITNAHKLAEKLKSIDIVIHCAGPFKYTAETMVKACILSKTHYIDITGEIAVFEKIHSYDTQAKQANIMLLPGAGFDIVPTDCMALQLKEQLPDATHLELAFYSTSHASRGTMNTMIEGLGSGGIIRKDGKLTPVPNAYKSKTIDFGVKQLLATTIPWGDVFTAYYTTHIPNIEVYLSTTTKQLRFQKFSNYIAPILNLGIVKNFLKRKINQRSAGPSNEDLENKYVYLYGKATNANNESKEMLLTVPNGYTLTAKTAIDIAKKITSGSWQAGYQTPAKLFGSDYILQFTKR